MNNNPVGYGPVFITGGPFKGRVGLYEDDTIYDSEIKELCYFKGRKNSEVAIVYFGDYFISPNYFYVNPKDMRFVTTHDLLTRRECLYKLLSKYSEPIYEGMDEDLYELDSHESLQELHFIDLLLSENYLSVRFKKDMIGKNIFISHSSKDKPFVRKVATDIKLFGHTPWLDEWDIRVGEFIPEKLSIGIENADFIIVVLSEAAMKSKWVEREWQTKYWDEISNNKIHILPILYSDCNIPTLLKSRKYADFRSDYNEGIEGVLDAINNL